MLFLEEYFNNQRIYEEKFGETVVLIIENGTFYEIYEYIPWKRGQIVNSMGESNIDIACRIKTDVKNNNTNIGKATEVAVILGIKITSRDSEKPHTLTNPLLCGIPKASFLHYKERLLYVGYTLVIMDQIGVNDKKEIIRKVVEIVTPATYNLNVNYSNEINIVCLYIDKSKNVGISCIDTHTGKSCVCEIYNRKIDDMFVIQEIIRFITAKYPKELIIYADEINEQELMVIKDEITLPIKFVHNKITKEYKNISYQEQFFNKIFSKLTSLLTLDIHDKPYGRISYILLLQYCYEHDETLILNLTYPDSTWINKETHCILTHNAIQQFDLLPASMSSIEILCAIKRDRKVTSLFELLNSSKTKLGARKFTLLFNPIIDKTKLQWYYNMTEIFCNEKNLRIKIRDALTSIHDTEMIHRKLKNKTIMPKQLALLFDSYSYMLIIYKLIFALPECSSLLLSKEHVENFNHYYMDINSKINFENCRQFSWCGEKFTSPENSIFKNNINEAIDQLQETIIAQKQKLLPIVEEINKLCPAIGGKYVELNTDGTIIISQTKYNILQKHGLFCKKVNFTRLKDKYAVTPTENFSLIEPLVSEMNILMKKEFITLMETFSKATYLNYIDNFIADIDYICANAHNACNMQYFKPILQETEQSSSFNAKNLRHPLSEQLIKQKFVPNDLDLQSSKGMLLYGINSSGKTCLTKSVGIAIIMAQAGMFTAGQITYSPYENIITRLSGNDNLIKGESSFIVEMMELRTILRNAGKNTLVLGDELCKGTESISGISLTIATVSELIERKTTFIFSTHMHELPETDYIKEFVQSRQLTIWHLEFTNSTYDRKLRNGSGKTTYGIEVCKSLQISEDFIEKANKIKLKLFGHLDILPTKHSRYNSNVYMDKCTKCGKISSLQTHHIEEQHKANIYGIIDYYHKNKEFNLMILCANCHELLHKNI